MNEKPIPVGPGDRVASIPAASSSIAAMGVIGLERMVPEFHKDFFRKMGVKLGADEGISPASVPNTLFVSKTRMQKRQDRFERGDVAIDTEKHVQVTVIKCAVGRTKKGTTVHRVVERKTGDSWRVAESKLKRLDE